MSLTNSSGFTVPYTNEVVTKERGLTQSWMNFFRSLQLLIAHISVENSFQLKNNQGSAVNIDGLQFDYRKVTQAFIEFTVRRITSTNELVATGLFAIVFKPKASTWHLVNIGTPGPDTTGVTFSITNSGQLQYTTTNQSGTLQVSTLTYRTRTMNAKVGAL